jgi:hypothetical protein
LKSCWSSRSPPRGGSWFGSSSSPSVDISTNLRFFLGGVLPASLSLLTLDLTLVSCRCFERHSDISMSVAVSSPPWSELSDPLCRGGDRTLFNLDPLLLGILSRGWCQGINASPCTCKDANQLEGGQHVGTQNQVVYKPCKSAIVSTRLLSGTRSSIARAIGTEVT